MGTATQRGEAETDNLLVLLGIARRQITAKRVPETGMTIKRKPLTEAPKSFGEWIRFERMHKGLTLRQLVTNSRVTRYRLRQIERDEIPPTATEITTIEDALKADGLETEAGGRQ